MKDKRSHNAIHALHAIRMTDQEKKTMLSRIVAIPAADAHSVSRSYKSPWTTYTLGVWISRQRWAVAALVLVVIAGGGGVASASEGALPGSTLYSVKVSIVEPIRDVFTLSPESRAEWQAQKAERRLNEATLLALQGKLDAPVQKDIEERLEKHSVAFASALDEVRQKGEEDRADEISVAFQAGLGARAQVLEVMAQDKHTDVPTEDRRMTVAAIARTGAQNVRDVRSSLRGGVVAKGDNSTQLTMMSMGVDPTESATSITVQTPENAAVDSVDNARATKSTPVAADTISTSTVESAPVSQNKNKQDSYKRSKTAAEKVIETVSENIKNISTKADSLRGKIVNNASVTLEEARQSLRDADKHFEAGEEDEAYMLILESERAAKEARILFNEGIKIHDQQEEDADEVSSKKDPASVNTSREEKKKGEHKATVIEAVRPTEIKKNSATTTPDSTEQKSDSPSKKDANGTKGKSRKSE